MDYFLALFPHRKQINFAPKSEPNGYSYGVDLRKRSENMCAANAGEVGGRAFQVDAHVSLLNIMLNETFKSHFRV